MKPYFAKLQGLNISRRVLLPVWVILFTLVLAGNTYLAVAQAVRSDDIDSLVNDTTFYDLVPLGSCGTAAEAGGVTLEGKDNIQKGFNFFIGKGLTPVQSAGIIGNFRHESGMNPKSKQLNGGPGRGLAQWEVGARWDTLQSWAKKRDRDPLDLLTQLEFAWQEMPKQFSYGYLPQLKAVLPKATADTSALEAIKMSTTVRVAAIAFQYTFERAGAESIDSRVTKAQETLDAFGGMVPDNVAPSGACGGSGITVDGYAFPVAPQTQRSYTNLPCVAGQNDNAVTVNYKPRGGPSVRITTCHKGDNSPAFDLMYSGVAGKPIYAITDIKVKNVNRSYTLPGSSEGGKPCGEMQVQSRNGTDNSYYWYGHILPSAEVRPGREFDVGEQIGTVATQEYGKLCWGGGPHLHIDRGCYVNKTPQQGGGDNCRDPQFLQDLQKIWEKLPPS